jgi:hypothetical protein
MEFNKTAKQFTFTTVLLFGYRCFTLTCIISKLWLATTQFHKLTSLSRSNTAYITNTIKKTTASASLYLASQKMSYLVMTVY